MKVLLTQLCLTLCDSQTVACQASLSIGFSREEYWRGLPCPPLVNTKTLEIVGSGRKGLKGIFKVPLDSLKEHIKRVYC